HRPRKFVVIFRSMSHANPACAHFRRRRSLLLGAAAAALPLGFARTARAADATPGAGLFEYSKYNGWPEVKESLMAGRIPAAYMLAPLVMDLADKKIP